MSVLIELAVPLILASVGIHALIFGTDIFPALCRGAMQGLETLKDMLPTLIVLFPAVYMLRASGALDALSAMLAPLMERMAYQPRRFRLRCCGLSAAAQLRLLLPISSKTAARIPLPGAPRL